MYLYVATGLTKLSSVNEFKHRASGEGSRVSIIRLDSHREE